MRQKSEHRRLIYVMTDFKKYMEKLKVTKGFSLVEIIMAVATIGLLSILIGSLPNSISLVGKSHHLSTVKEIASKKVEDLRAIPYSNLQNGETQIDDYRLNLIPQGNGTTTIEDCMDICAPGEYVKKVTVELEWQEGAVPRAYKVQTLIADNGL